MHDTRKMGAGALTLFRYYVFFYFVNKKLNRVKISHSEVPPERDSRKERTPICFRSHAHMPRMSAPIPHDNQLAAATEIISRYEDDSNLYRYGVLYAHCQSGKTGTFHTVARQMLARKMVDRVYLLCGSAEVVLRAQAHDDAVELNAAAYGSGKFKVLFHQDFKKHSLNRVRSLIILDESHMDQDGKQKLCQFALANGFDFWGTTPRMVEENTYILSVSATPYSELSDIYHKVTPNKFVVELQPGPGYRGVEYYLYNGLLKPTFDAVEEWDKFIAITLTKGNAWNFVRSHSAKEAALCDTLEEKAAAAGIRLLHYTQGKKDVAITWKEKQSMAAGTPCMQTLNAAGEIVACPPDRPTIILLKGKLRAGKVVPKEFVGFAWEDSKNPQTDVIIQSLLGRMCGYKFGASMPEIFISPKLLEQANGIIKSNAIVRHSMMPVLMPKKGRNLAGARDGSDPDAHDRHPCVPLYLKANDLREFDLTRYGGGAAAAARGDESHTPIAHAIENPPQKNHKMDDATKSQMVEAVMAFISEKRLIESSPHYTPEQKVEIESGWGKVYLRHQKRETEDHQKQAFVDFKEAALEGFCPVHRIHKNKVNAEGKKINPIVTLILCHTAYGTLQKGDIIVYFNATHRGAKWMARQDLRTRFPTTSGKEMFRVRLPEAAAAEAVGTVSVCLRNTIFSSPHAFRNQLRSIIRFEQEETEKGEDGLIVARKISGLQRTANSFIGMKKAAYGFTDKKVNGAASICEELSAELGVTIKMSLIENMHDPSLFHITKISWMPL